MYVQTSSVPEVSTGSPHTVFSLNFFFKIKYLIHVYPASYKEHNPLRTVMLPVCAWAQSQPLGHRQHTNGHAPRKSDSSFPSSCQGATLKDQ